MRRVLACAVAAGVVAAGSVWPSTYAAGPVREIVLASPHTATAPTFDAAVGGAVFFTTDEPLVALDTDDLADVYRWRDGALALMTADLTGPATFDTASTDGNTVLVSVPGIGGEGDAGGGWDVFRCAPRCSVRTEGIGGDDATFAAASPDAVTLVYESTAPAQDGLSSGTAVERTSAPGYYDVVARGQGDVHFAGASTAFGYIFLTTADKLLQADTNTAADVYVSAGGPPGLVSNGAGGPDTFEATTPNGAAAFWSTADDDASQGDTDGVTDIYRWGGPPQSLLISLGTAQPVTFDAASGDGDHAFFTTGESLADADTDTFDDVYRWDVDQALPSGGTLTLMSGAAPTGQPATFDAAAPDGSSVVFSAAGGVYRSTGTTSQLLSGGMVATWAGASTSGAVQFFTSGGGLYQADAAGLTKIAGGNATYKGSSSGGSVWFSTAAKLSPADTDAAADIYLSRPDITPPSVTVTAPSPQLNDGAIEVRARCTDPAPCRTVARGALRVPAADGTVRRFALQTRRATIGPARGVLLHLGVPATAQHAAARALRAGRRVVADLTVTVRDPAGNTRVVRRTVRLRG